MIDREELKIRLTKFLFDNKPIGVLNHDLFVILRTNYLMLVKGHQLQLGDIRILQAPSIDFVRGLDPVQWTTLLLKCITLQNICEFPLCEIKNGTDSGK